MVWTGIEVNSSDVGLRSLQVGGGEKIEERGGNGEEEMMKQISR